MRHRTKENWKATGAWCALLAGLIMVLLLMPYWFANLDCSTAEKNLRFFEVCKQDQHCTLTHAERLRYKSYVRMQSMNCPSKD